VDLVVDEVVELEHVEIADGDPLVELVAGPAVVEHRLAVLGQAGLLQALADDVLAGAIEDGADRLEAELGRGPAQVGLEDLAHVHPARHAQGVQEDLDGVPSARNGMSSSGRILAMTPLLPWRPAILSPTEMTRLVAM
jgi:hypothetical protein